MKSKISRSALLTLGDGDRAIMPFLLPGGKVDTFQSASRSTQTENYIVVHLNGDLTMVGGAAWRLYSALRTFRFLDTRVTLPVRDMRHLLEHATPCDNVLPQIEQCLRVEAALLGADLDWPEFTCGPVALRLAFDLLED